MNASAKWESLTAIMVVQGQAPEATLVQALATELGKVGNDSELILIANGVSPEITQRLQSIAAAIPDLTVHFLADQVDADLATLVGIDHALGDWIIVLTPTAEEVDGLPEILRHAGPFEIVFAGAPESRSLPFVYRTLASWYFRLYQFSSGVAIEWPAPRVRVYSRAAARYLANCLDGEFMLRSLAFSGAFPGIRLTIERLPPDDPPLLRETLWRAARKALRGLFTASAVTMRATIFLAAITGVLSAMGALYAVASYVLRSEIEPGWTTLSLQISMMMFLFAAMFALLAEYVLNVYRATTPRRRIMIVREMRSPLRRQRSRLNVIDADGSFQLGAPQSPTLPNPPNKTSNTP